MNKEEMLQELARLAEIIYERVDRNAGYAARKGLDTAAGRYYLGEANAYKSVHYMLADLIAKGMTEE